MSTPENYVVIGAGHGGKAMAAHLAIMGFRVVLYNRTFDHVAVLKARGGIELESSEGGPHGFGTLAEVTSDLNEALQDAQMIMVVVPSSAHADVAKKIAPYLKDGQIIVLHPGRTCGALEFTKVLHDCECSADVTVAEAETFIYASRSDGPAQARIFRIKEAVPMAALPATRTQVVLDAIHPAYPQFIDGTNVLHTGLNNMGAMGVKISIDDFGTGYSSLSYLKQLPVDELKIDKSFVMGITEDDNDAVIVRSTIDLAHNIGLKVVAEGVENQLVYNLLAGLHCDAAQGYYMGEALSASELIKWLQNSPFGMKKHRQHPQFS